MEAWFESVVVMTFDAIGANPPTVIADFNSAAWRNLAGSSRNRYF
jgi:hypothetical protein